MDLTEWMFFKFLLISAAGILLMFPAAAEKSGSDLTCIVSQQPDGAFVYLLSKPPSSASCTNEWEDKNKTLIVFNQDSDQKLVENLTDRSVTLRVCLDYLRYKSDCLEVEGFKEALCRVNCSFLSDKFSGNLIQNSSVNSTLICFSKNWCPKKLYVGLVLGGIILLIILGSIGSLQFFCKCKLFKCRSEGSATGNISYTAASKDETEKVEIDFS